MWQARQPPPPPPPPVCNAGDWAMILSTTVLAAVLSWRSDGTRFVRAFLSSMPAGKPHVSACPHACLHRRWRVSNRCLLAGRLFLCRPYVATVSALLPAVVGAWWCRSAAAGEAADEDRALALLWSTAGCGFLGVFCAAMLGVREKVCERDLERAMTDTTSLFVSSAPAAHAALLWLSQGPAVVAPAVAAGVAGAMLGAIARWLCFPEHLRAVAVAAGFVISVSLAALWTHGQLCLIAWCSACVARAYEFGIR